MSQNWTADLYDAPHLLPESKQTIPIIQDLIAGTENAKDAASRVAAVFEDRIKNGNNETPNGLWVVFCTAVDRLGSDEKVITLLIDFLLSLASLNVLDASGNPIASNCNGDAFWSQLPGFSLVFRDELTSKSFPAPPSRRQPLTHTPGIDNTDSIADAQWAAEKRRFRNANVFQATWLGRVADRGPRRERLSAQTFALWHISSALDCGVPDTALGRRRTEMYVPQAAQWVLLAGAVVYRLCREDVENNGEPARERCQGDEAVEGWLWTGPEGFSLARWAWWRRRFAEIAAMEGVEAEVKELARSAAERMGAIQNSEK